MVSQRCYALDWRSTLSSRSQSHFFSVLFININRGSLLYRQILSNLEATTEDEEAITANRKTLADRVIPWRKWRDKVMSNTFQISIEPPPDFSIEDVSTLDLVLPSSPQSRPQVQAQTAKLNRLRRIEFKLRHALAQETLYNLRRHISVRALYEDRQHDKTAAIAVITRNQKQLQAAVLRVCSVRQSRLVELMSIRNRRKPRGTFTTAISTLCSN